MIELELLGVGGDGQSLVLTDATGERYAIPITDELRGAVRRDRPHIEVVGGTAERTLRPGEIQSLLRGGQTAEEIAQQYSVDVTHVQRFEAPITAEKNWALSRALESHVGGDREAPVLSDLVVDRLAARGVEPASLSWSARRAQDGPWEISLTFVQAAAEHAARWSLSSNAGSVEALDQEARWLTETVAPAPVSAIFTPLPTRRSDEDIDDSAKDSRARESLLDQLNAARGRRQDIDLDIEGPDEEGTDLGPLPGVDPSATDDVDEDDRPSPAHDSISARIHSLAHSGLRGQDPLSAAKQPMIASGSSEEGTSGSAATPAGATAPIPIPDRFTAPASSATAEPTDATLPGLDAIIPAPADREHKSERKKSRRRSVPSWDEIVFGSRPQ